MLQKLVSMTPSAQVSLRAAAAALVLSAAAGCGPTVYPVTLTLTLTLTLALADGQPLTAGAVVLLHATDPVVLGGGPIEADGTCRPMLRGRSAPGLPAGTYRVGVSGSAPANLDKPSPPVPFDLIYANPAASGLTLAVGPGSPEKTSFSLGKNDGWRLSRSRSAHLHEQPDLTLGDPPAHHGLVGPLARHLAQKPVPS